LNANGYLRSWTGGFVRAKLTAEGIPTSYSVRGELQNDDDAPTGLAGWFVIVRTPEMRVPGIGTLELQLDRYDHHDVNENDEPGPVALVFSTAQRVTLTLHPVVEDPS
jgi:hypothetical protein